MKVKVLVATFPYGGSEVVAVRNWLVTTAKQMATDPRIESVHHMDVNDTPITMSRNRVAKFALQSGFDYVLMVDSDMHPDMYLGNPAALAKPFWPSSFEFALSHRDRPLCVAAPYCGPPPHENVYIFRWANKQSDHPNADLSLEQYSREEAAIRAGFEEVAALPTGIFLADVRAFERVKPSWFEYEYEDPPYNTRKASTEDVFFTRNASLAGVPQYVNWDAWAGHAKYKVVGKPSLLTCDQVRDSFREALMQPPAHVERLVDVAPRNGFDPLDCKRLPVFKE